MLSASSSATSVRGDCNGDAFSALDIDTSVLDGTSIDRDDWREIVTEVLGCFEVRD